MNNELALRPDTRWHGESGQTSELDSGTNAFSNRYDFSAQSSTLTLVNPNLNFSGNLNPVIYPSQNTSRSRMAPLGSARVPMSQSNSVLSLNHADHLSASMDQLHLRSMEPSRSGVHSRGYEASFAEPSSASSTQFGAVASVRSGRNYQHLSGFNRLSGQNAPFVSMSTESTPCASALHSPAVRPRAIENRDDNANENPFFQLRNDSTMQDNVDARVGLVKQRLEELTDRHATDRSPMHSMVKSVRQSAFRPVVAYRQTAAEEELNDDSPMTARTVSDLDTSRLNSSANVLGGAMSSSHSEMLRASTVLRRSYDPLFGGASCNGNSNGPLNLNVRTPSGSESHVSERPPVITNVRTAHLGPTAAQLSPDRSEQSRTGPPSVQNGCANITGSNLSSVDSGVASETSHSRSSLSQFDQRAYYEHLLREKNLEVQQLRNTMERNEEAMTRVFEARRHEWINECEALRAEADRRIAMERERCAQLEQQVQFLTTQLEQLQTTVCANSGLSQRVQELSQANRNYNQQLDNVKWSLQQKQGELALLRSQYKDSQSDLLTARQLAKQMEIQNNQLRDERTQLESKALKTEEATKELADRLEQVTRELSLLRQTRGLPLRLEIASQTEDITSPVRDRIAILEQTLSSREQDFERERSQWLEEKAKVINYQKQLQLHLMQLAQQNKRLEAEMMQPTQIRNDIIIPPLD